MTTKYRLVIEHDQDPDFSWLDSGEDPDTHVALCLILYAFTDADEDWQVIDSLGNIDFLADGDDWITGTFYRVDAIPERCAYLRELASDMIQTYETAPAYV